MVYKRRTGADRRNIVVPVDTEKRRNNERREMLRDPDQTAGRLRTISIFDSLSTCQLVNLLRICSKKLFKRGETIFNAGDESDFMFILIQGRLQILFPDGAVIDNGKPPELVGQMGLLTGECRTITVAAATDCVALLFGKEELFRVFHTDTDIWIKVLTNIIREQTANLRTENEIHKNMQRMRAFRVL